MSPRPQTARPRRRRTGRGASALVLAVGLGLGLTPVAWAAGAGASAELEAYKTESKASDLRLSNPDFRADLATSRATRGSLGVNEQVGGSEPGGRTATATDAVNFASPTIYGTVRGDVTVIVQPGAVRGGLTVVNRRR